MLKLAPTQLLIVPLSTQQRSVWGLKSTICADWSQRRSWPALPDYRSSRNRWQHKGRQRSVLAGQVGVADNADIGDGTMVGAQSGISGKIAPGSKLAGTPVMPAGTFLKSAGVCMPKLPDLFKRVKKLEKELKAVKEAAGNGE